MSEKIKKLLNNKYFIVALVALLIVLVIGTGTYAWLTWSSPNTTKLTVKIGNIADVIFDNGKEINTTSLAPVFTSDQGEKTSFSIVKRSSAGSTNIDYTITLNVTSIATELKTTSFKYMLVNVTNANQVVKQGNFSTASTGDTITLNSGTLTDARADFTFVIYIDGNVENNTNMMKKAFKATLNVSASESDTGKTMTKLIKQLYDSNQDKVMVNEGSSTNYYIASTVSLMNDGLGYGETQTSDSGNIRYYGLSPDNYIYFNCDTYPDDGCEVWRIIGVFKEGLKIIRNEPVSSTPVPMHLEASTGIDWRESAVGQLFNNQEKGCLSYWDPAFDATETCGINSLINNYSDSYLNEIASAGLKNDKTRLMISAYPNYLFSYVDIINNNRVTIEELYNYTVSNQYDKVYPLSVGILDVVDYGYASDFANDCTAGISSIDELGVCGNQTWLYNRFTETEYFINVEDGYALATNGQGTIESGLSIVDVSGLYRPVVYLFEDVKYISGNGREDDPYTINYNY